jgi:hypothetical protein
VLASVHPTDFQDLVEANSLAMGCKGEVSMSLRQYVFTGFQLLGGLGFERARLLCIALSLCGTPIDTRAQSQNPGGTARGWGDDQYGQSTAPVGLSNLVSISASWDHSLGLKNDGRVAVWGDNIWGQGTVPAGLSNVVAIAAGDYHSMALKRDGSVVAWGAGTGTKGEPHYGQSAVPPGLSRVVAIAGGGYHSLALRNDGTVVAWGAGGPGTSGQPNYGQSAVPAGLSNAVAIAAGFYHSLALRQDGTVIGWGNNFDGQSSVPAGLSNVVAIGAGDWHSVALKNDGTVFAWGYNSDGESIVPAGLSNVAAITAGAFHTLALKNDGTVVAWGWNYAGECTVPTGLSGVGAVAAGRFHSLALVYPGTLAPIIEESPLTQTAEAGSTLELGVQASGPLLLSYQWFFNRTNALSTPIADPVLVVTNLPFSLSGSYEVVVSNAFGAVTSSPVTVSVIAPVPRRSFPGIEITADPGSSLNLEFADVLGPPANWALLERVYLTNAPQYFFDVFLPQPSQRFYRAWQTGVSNALTSLDLHMVPAITLEGSVGSSVRVDFINQFGSVDAWVTLDRVTLTSISQLYFDTSAIGQPPRLWRIVPVP